MGIDASIYSNIQNPAASAPSMLDAAEKGMRLSALGMQQAQQGYQLQTQAAVRNAYAQNIDSQTGQLNRAGFLSQLGKEAPQAIGGFQTQFAQQDKAQAEARTAQAAAAEKALEVVWPQLDWVEKTKNEQKPQAYAAMLKSLNDQGIDTTHFPKEYDPSTFATMHGMAANSKPALESLVAQSNIAAKPAELNATLYGSRSPNAELSSQYNTDAKTVRSSQMAMQQMIDNYHNPSPQGYASLKLNAFKIKFPNAPDVNSLEELSNAQGVTDQMRAWVNQHASGTDQTTMDNLMRDGISTYRANVDSLRGIQKRYQARQKVQNVNDPSLTYEPAIEKTFADAMDLQKKIGAYVPPEERGGVLGAIGKGASKLLGGGVQSANASQSKFQPGAVVMIKGTHYTVGEDGDTLNPVVGASKK